MEHSQVMFALLMFAACSSGAFALQCYVCQGPSNSDCGRNPTNLVNCPQGIDMCYTQVTGFAGAVPNFYRGCGQASCRLIPDPATWGALCDQVTDRVILPVNPATRMSSQVFSSKSLVSSVQHCDTDRCNNGTLQVVQLPGFYTVHDSSSTSLAASQAAIIPASISLALAYFFA